MGVRVSAAAGQSQPRGLAGCAGAWGRRGAGGAWPSRQRGGGHAAEGGRAGGRRGGRAGGGRAYKGPRVAREGGRQAVRPC